MKKVLIFLICTLSIIQISAQYYTISGYITDEKSGETLINASIYDINSRKGTVANVYGFYSLTLPKGQIDLQYSYVGYATQARKFNLQKDTVINIRFKPSIDLQEITVIGHQRITGVQSAQMSAVEVPISQIKSVPTLFGEADLVKALQLLPGVQSGSEGSTGMYVRGGGPDQNLFLLDGIPVYNVNHMAGFFSVFNPDAIKNVTLYKGSFPARFGGRLSSVIDVRMNDGNDKKIHGNVSIGIVSSKINIEGPIIKEKTTFNISARRTYSDLLMQPIIMLGMAKDFQDEEGNLTSGYYFYDLNAKINHKFSNNDRLYLSLYMGDDIIYTNYRNRYSNIYDEKDRSREESSERMKLKWNWGNIVTSVRWNHMINNKLFMNATAAYTRYRFDMGVGSESKSTTTYPDSTSFEFSEFYIGYKSGIEDYTLKADFDYAPHPNHDVKFGANYTNHTFRPGVTVSKLTYKTNIQSQQLNINIGDKNIYSHETMFFAEDNISIGYALKANLGVHYSFFNVEKEIYHSLQPRVSMRMLANDNLSFKAGYAGMSQNVHLLSNSYVSLPTDLWVPVTKRIKPMRSHQYSVGAFYNLKDIVDLSIEGYYKSMHNLIEYKDGASFLGSSTGWEDKVVMGDGWAYGIELLAQKSIGKTTGWIGYTWSKAERLFNRPGQELNYGKVFPAKYDRRHDVSLVLSHKFSDRFDLSGTWVFSTGNTGTLALQHYAAGTTPDTNNNNVSDELNYISGRNNFRFNPYHRMDIGMNFHKKKKYGTRTWNISIYNAYNNNNPFLVLPKEDKEQIPGTNNYVTKKSLIQISVFPIIPSVSYSYKW
ncbi:MAG: TonB-dependent receptor [Paludibacter sp.]|nr:TonB-dependent receptor [Paludibacter sp.]MDD4198854.1 TonB-dependent receptor [Paludibacter sp.]MDD4428384.1 TonB-dependent receptor [Paludibacter sp.]